MKTIIFSYNRPAQLDLLLRSMKRFTDFDDIYVSFMYDDEYEEGYERVIKDNPDVDFEYRKKNLKKYVLKALKKPLTAFFCDDDILIGKVSKSDPEFDFSDPELLCLSLRLGNNVNYSFDRGSKQPAPKDLKWYWKSKELDWNYPMSVSGHVFRTEYIKPLIMALDFDTPTQLEDRMAQNPIDKIWMIRYAEQKCVETPLNVVQSEAFCNKTGKVTPKYLNDEFMKGQEIDLDEILKNKFNSPHQLVEVKWRKI